MCLYIYIYFLEIRLQSLTAFDVSFTINSNSNIKLIIVSCSIR